MAITVFFSPLMQAEAASYSPSAGKPTQVVDSWQKLGIPMEIRAPAPATREQLLLAHAADFVDGVLEGRHSNGFGNRSLEVAASLPYTCGSMLAAAEQALANGKGAVAPCSGFHHAGHDFAGGFCTFNGLMVTALSLLKDKKLKKLAILDLDMHYGNGTQDIIDTLNVGHEVKHWSRSFSPSRAEEFLENLPYLVKTLCEGCELLLYQAGADSHCNDPLGGYLTTDQMRRRDELVFDAARALDIPIAWNLAGGYQRDAQGGIRPVLDLHDNTMRAFARITMTMTEKRV